VDQTTLQVGRAMSLTISALFSYVLFHLVWTNRLKYFLNVDLFRNIVITAAGFLGILVCLKAVGMYRDWRKSLGGQTPSHDCCSHEHEGHSHDHGVSLWRLMVLVFPLMLLMAGVVPTKVTAQAMLRRQSKDQQLAIDINVSTLPPERANLKNATAKAATLPELMAAARNPSSRGYWENTKDPVVATVVGEYLPASQYPDRYQLMQRKRTCCSADDTPVLITVLGVPDSSLRAEDWIEVTGALTFPTDKRGGYTSVLHQINANKLPAPPSEAWVR
jgi:uncharacterized membrane protein YcgQ (UPF0703/DUF1980 family)